MLPQSLRDERQGQGRAVHGHRHLPQEVRQGADVILVAVREDDGAEPLAPAAHVREIGNDVIDAGQLVVREHEPAVDRDQVLAGLDQHHVEADLAETSEGDQSDDGFHGTPFTVERPDRTTHPQIHRNFAERRGGGRRDPSSRNA